MRDENCIFCKIIAGEIPSNTIYEDDEFKVVLDVSPASKGHALILPKNHYGSEQSRSSRTDSIPFPYAPDSKIPQCKEQ